MVRSPRHRSVLLDRLAATPRSGPPAVLEEVRRVILDGGAPPGTAIPVADVAALFGVSPIPVREALKTLVGEGLVGHRPNAGYVVAQLTRDELREIYIVRGVLEGAALRAAVQDASPADHEAATRAHLALGEAVASSDQRGYHRESRSFHLALIGPCRMHRLLRMFEAAWNVTEPFQPMRYLTDADRQVLHADHGEMLLAFRDRDAERLVDRAGEHHRRLEAVIATLPADAGLRVD